MRRALSTFAALVLGTLAVQQIAARCFGDPWSGVARLTERWVYYDGHRYLQIAHEGYSWNADAQSTVAWFPLYPLLIRALSWLGGRPTNWAALITLVAGATAFVLYDRWAASSSWVPLGLFALMPYAFYLYGIVYADALFVALCLGAWLAFDRSAVGASVVLSALATATRPTGVALVAGLMVAGYLRRRRPADAGVQALGLVGLGAYIAFQWWRFDEPLGFLSTQRHFRAGAAPIGNTRLIEALVSGWRSASLFEVGAAVVLAAVGVGSAAWIGRRYSRGAAVAVLGFAGAFIVTIARWPDFVSFPAYRSTTAAQGLLCLAAAVSVPAVARRHGLGAATYVAVLVAIPTVSTGDFMGAGRYLIAAFPLWTTWGGWLAERGRVARVVLAASGVAMVCLSVAFTRGGYIA